jgi:uncharacterized protein YcfJ
LASEPAATRTRYDEVAVRQDVYTTFIESTLRQMVYQRQDDTSGAVAGSELGAVAGGVMGGSRSAGGGAGAKASGRAGDWLRSDAYSDMVSQRGTSACGAGGMRLVRASDK